MLIEPQPKSTHSPIWVRSLGSTYVVFASVPLNKRSYCYTIRALNLDYRVARYVYVTFTIRVLVFVIKDVPLFSSSTVAVCWLTLGARLKLF